MENNYITNKITGEKIQSTFNFHVAENDCPKGMSWNDAKALSSQMGEGWRLPTSTEIEQMKTMKTILGMNRSIYWASDEDGNMAFSKGFKWFTVSRFVIKQSRCYVRFVKSLAPIEEKTSNNEDVIPLSNDIIEM